MLENLFIGDTFSIEDQSIFELSNADQSAIEAERKNIDRIIFGNSEALNALDFSIDTNRAFIFLLLDLCEQLQIADAFQILLNISEKNKIGIGSRLFAASLFFTGISEASQYFSRFENICKHLQISIDAEEDNNLKPLATFANYYLRVLSLHPQWITLLKTKIQENKSNYNFLSEPFIVEILDIPTKKKTECKEHIISLKDKLLNRVNLPIVNEINDSDLMESNTPYSDQLRALSHLSFQTIRQISINKNTIRDRLNNRGVKPLTTEEELYKYMVSFGNMHYAKLCSALNVLTDENISGNVEVIDWGCGQAVATMVLGEYCNGRKIDMDVSKIILIDPSGIAIKRANLHASLFFPDSQIKTVCKYIDELEPQDLQTNFDSIKIHLFSNILDVELFSLLKLQRLISSTQKGINYFICVSPYINDLRTERLNGFERYFNQNQPFEKLANETNSKQNNFWYCNNSFNNNPCVNHLQQRDSCDNKWTRVLRVFKTTFN